MLARFAPSASLRSPNPIPLTRKGSHPNTPQFYIPSGHVNGGEGGIRTHVPRSSGTAFRERRLKPLGNLSLQPPYKLGYPSSINGMNLPRFMPKGGMCSFASLPPPPFGRRTHVPRSSGTAFRERRLKPLGNLSGLHFVSQLSVRTSEQIFRRSCSPNF